MAVRTRIPAEDFKQVTRFKSLKSFFLHNARVRFSVRKEGSWGCKVTCHTLMIEGKAL